jgi:hypothetical protein
MSLLEREPRVVTPEPTSVAPLLVVFEVADRIVVLRVGRRVATFEQRETTPQEVVGAIVASVGTWRA